MGCKDGKWMELAQVRVQWWDLVLAVLNLSGFDTEYLFILIIKIK
jgi:hypothetical protein